MTTTTREKLVSEIETFLKRTKLAPTEFGRLAANDMSLVKRLRDGADVRTATADRLREFMRSFNPTDGKPPLAPKHKGGSVAAAA